MEDLINNAAIVGFNEGATSVETGKELQSIQLEETIHAIFDQCRHCMNGEKSEEFAESRIQCQAPGRTNGLRISPSGFTCMGDKFDPRKEFKDFVNAICVKNT